MDPVLGNAEELERIVARGRTGLPRLTKDDDRVRRGAAIDGFAKYAQLLREAASGVRPTRYSFCFEGAPWQILGHREVRPRPSAARPHHFLAGAPTAA